MLSSEASKAIREYVPKPVAAVASPIRRLITRVWNRAKYGFAPPPDGTDLVGYETLIDFIKANRIFELPGDVVEVGAFCGGGTYKLSKLVSRMARGKMVHVVDSFEIEFDKTECTAGIQMSQLYAQHLNGRSQKDVFSEVTHGLQNLKVVEGDSKGAQINAEMICFAFIDGNHSPEYVQNDFYLVWSKLSPGGVVAFHDYGHDLPRVTAMLDRLCAIHLEEISNRFVNEAKHILFIQKRHARAQ